MEKNIPYLDGWRGAAISCLLIGHFFAIPGINLGTVGVGLFFVLSGLLMANVLFVKEVGFGTFYRRRVARVFPSVAVYLAVILGVWVVTGQPISATEFLSALTFTNNYFVVDRWVMPLGHIWSLSVEEHSYVILSLAALWCRTHEGRGRSAIGLILAVIIAAIAVYTLVPSAKVSGYHSHTEVASLGIFAAGFIFLSMTEGGVRLSRPWVSPIALMIGGAAYWWSVPPGLRLIAGPIAFAVAINGMAGAPGWYRSIFEFGWLRRLGTCSFSLYLWQQPFYQLYRHHGMSPVLGLILASTAGWAAFHLIEHPARLYLNKRWGAKPGVVIDPESSNIRAEI
ncbi:acyltransferase family protein [Massilia sp. 2TAF26]|uniref:acyltransferase family protein n=1 Tax=Massilia sp. 2TAF26 TaxID=3233012 RepID=UPI003F94324F